MNTRYMNSCGCDSMNKPEMISRPKKSLAMAYVPWQQWQDVMDGCSGLKHGTIFEELVMPFGGTKTACAHCGNAPQNYMNYNNYNRRGMK